MVTSEAMEPSTQALTNLEAELLRAGWLLVDAHERLGITASRRVFGQDHKAWSEYARSTIHDLDAWPGDNHFRRVHESDEDRVRHRRVLDFVRPGDRIFDVGFGRGYLLGVLLREGQLAAYHGIEVVESYLPVVENLLEETRPSTEIGLEICDLYDLTADQTTGTDLMICCEVLEHVPDAEKALRTIATALPDDADVLFSVPMFGRLEQVWGHLSVFDTHRLKRMLAGAGLYAHHVEPVANTWTFVLASNNPKPSERVAAAQQCPPAEGQPLTEHRMFRDVPMSEIALSHAGIDAVTTLEATKGSRVRCTIEPSASRGAETQDAYGGLTFGVGSLTALRVQLFLTEAASIRRFYINLLNGSMRVARWIWTPSRKQLSQKTPFRFALRPGEDGNRFKVVESTDGAPVTGVEILAAVDPEARSSFEVRAAYLP